MKNLKKILLSMMVLFLAFAFIGCPAEPDPEPPITPEPTPEPETPVVTNNFKGKTFLGMTGEGEAARFASYIIFTSDKDCEVMFFDEEPMPATYTVADDVATLKGTGEYAALQLSTTKLTDGKFSITIPSAVSGEEEDIVVSYAVGTLWTILYDIPDSDEDFSLKMPEEYLEYYVQQFGLVDGDYTKDDAEKTITLTASGWAKVQAGNKPPVPPAEPVVTNNFKGKTFIGMTGEGEAARFASYIIFTSDTDCEVMFFDKEPMPAKYTVADDVATLIGTGEYAALQLSTTKLTDDDTFEITIPPAVSLQENDIVVSYAVGTLWTIFYDIPDSDEDFSWKMPEQELDFAVENFGFVEADYNKDEATKTITLTPSGYAKVQAAMGGLEGEAGDVTSKIVYDGNLVRTFESLDVAENFVSSIRLGEDVDYTIDDATKTITLLTEDSLNIVNGAWTVLDPEGKFLMAFPTLSAAASFATENGLDINNDCTRDDGTKTITLTADAWEKLKAGE